MSTNGTIELPEHLWRALEVMSRDMDVPPAALARQAVFAWLRINGYLLPSPVLAPPGEGPPVAREGEVRGPTPGEAAALDHAVARLAEVDADLERLTRPRPPWREEPAEAPPPGEIEEQPTPQALLADADPGASELVRALDPVPDPPSGEAPLVDVDEPAQQATGMIPQAVPGGEEEEGFEEGTVLLKGPPLAVYIEREGQERVRVTGERFVLGRGPQCDLIVDSPRVSREHAVLIRQGMTYLLEDLASSNGTFVGDERITRQELQSGDVVRLGNEVLLVVIRAEEEEPSSPPAP
jgi:FHA domain